MNTEQVKQLIDKFYRGETSLEEEQQLQEYFKNKDLPDELGNDAAYFRYSHTFSK